MTFNEQIQVEVAACLMEMPQHSPQIDLPTKGE